MYTPPDASKLRASTTRVSVAVDRAHTHAREAQGKVNEAAAIAKKVHEETKRIENVPPSVVEGLVSLELRLDEARQTQASLEKDLVEADQAKADAKRDGEAYFQSAQKLADYATDERAKRIKAEKEASHLKWNSWLYRILGTVGVILMIGLIVLWIMGRLAIKLSG